MLIKLLVPVVTSDSMIWCAISRSLSTGEGVVTLGTGVGVCVAVGVSVAGGVGITVGVAIEVGVAGTGTTFSPHAVPMRVASNRVLTRNRII